MEEEGVPSDQQRLTVNLVSSGFEVRAELRSGWSTWSPIVWIAAQQLNQSMAAQMNTITELAITLFMAVIVFGAIIALLWLMRKRHPHGSKAAESTVSPLIPVLYSSPGTYKPCYVDPSTYEDPYLAVQDFTTEIERFRVCSVSVIGSGEFGEVCRGTLLTSSGADQSVAIKVLKQVSSDKAKADFLAEASIMGQFNHPNVISLRGVITTSDPAMIVTEYMENGSLDAFVRRQSTLVPVQMTYMLRGIACGMKYLSDMGFVHRDLAARNVLVGAQLLCKISDFGLSRKTDGSTEQVYTMRGGKIPVRWTAPEAIGYRKFTSASDVWSFGVVMWEVFNFGERPYGEWSNQQVIHSIEQGYRLPPIYDTPQVILDLMLQCWQRERQFRPTFTKLAHTLEEFNRCPDVYAQLTCAPLCNAQSCAFDRCYTTPSSSTLPLLPPRTYPTTYGYHANPPGYNHHDRRHPYRTVGNTTTSKSPCQHLSTNPSTERRSPTAIASVHTGKLHAPLELCPDAFNEELAYWKLDDKAVEPCCSDMENGELAAASPDPAFEAEMQKKRTCRQKLWLFLDDPGSSKGALVFMILSMLFVLTTMVTLTISTLPEYRAAYNTSNVDPTEFSNLEIIDGVCVSFFAIEWILRMLSTPRPCAFLVSAMSIIDLLTTVPFFIEVGLEKGAQIDLNYLDNMRRSLVLIRILRVLRVLRALRVLKMARYSSGFRLIGTALRRCMRELLLLLLLMLVGGFIFSTLMFFFEEGNPDTQYTSIPAAGYWCIITMTTVGYGDVYPVTTLGRILAGVVSISGIVLLAFPISMIVDTFNQEYKQKGGGRGKGNVVHDGGGSSRVPFVKL